MKVFARLSKDKAHVIRCNDSVEAVFVGPFEYAEALCVSMRDECFKKLISGGADPRLTWDDFMLRYYWRVASADLYRKGKS